MKIQKFIVPVIEDGLISFKSVRKNKFYLQRKTISTEVGMDKSTVDFGIGFDLDHDGDLRLPTGLDLSEAVNFCRSLQIFIDNYFTWSSVAKSSCKTFVDKFEKIDFRVDETKKIRLR